MSLISNSKDLKAFCNTLKKAEFITVDTEFIRERTYWARLCLIQVAGPDDAVAIDPLAEGIDLKPLYDIFLDKKILKVFHACRQDLEIFFKEMNGKLPAPIFDTQVAAMVCGFGEQAGYETLVKRIARQPLGAVKATKQLMRSVETVKAQMDVEGREFRARLQSPEAKEAFTAFAMRRAPDFSQFN